MVFRLETWTKIMSVYRWHNPIHRKSQRIHEKIIRAKKKKEFISKVAGYKRNIQKWGVFLYTNNKHYKNEIKKKTIPFRVASKRKTYLGIN